VADSEIEELMRLFIDAGEKGDLSPLLNLIHDDIQYIDASGDEYDKAGLLGLLSSISSLWPDRKYHTDGWVAQGNTVWIEQTHTMTHVNEFHGIPPTNKKVKNSIVWIFEVEDGKIKQIREYEKFPEYLMRQLRE